MSEKLTKGRLAGVRPAIRSTAARLVSERTERAEGTVLSILESQSSAASLESWIDCYGDLIHARLLRDGAVLFRNFGVNSPDKFASVVNRFGGPRIEYRERSSPRLQVADQIYTSTEYPAHQAIFPHNENSYAHLWPKKIFFCCLTPAETGGCTPIVDVRSVYKSLAPAVRAKFETSGVLYLRNFSERLGLSWRTAFQTSEREEVERSAATAGYSLEWLSEDRLRTRRTGRATGLHPDTSEAIWFNHAAFFHITTLPAAIREPLTAGLEELDFPNHSYYGDGSPIEHDVMEHVRACYRRHELTFRWQRGDVLLLDNMLVAHARQPYTGPRRILVSMTEPFQSKWFTS